MTDREFPPHDITRRDFVRLSAATGGALALPGGATASVGSAKFDAEYQYVLNHTPAEYAVPTLVTFADAAGFDALDAVAAGEARTTTTPRPAAYTTLTTAQAEQAADIPTAEEFSHSPGANPFWRLGYYPLGVFPDPQRSTDFIDYEEMVAGMEHLQSQHSDRMEFYSIGKSPGHYNEVTDRDDPKDIYVVELTNDIDDEETYEEKAKVMYTLSIHGAERPGAEAGSRFIENLLDGRETEIEALLDDLVLIFIYQNPDGWVAKHPQYEPTAGPLYQRGNAEVGDTNRQYPISGWIDPIHYPAEPDGRNLEDDQPGIDVDVPDGIRESVPDALALVEHFRDYENLDYGVDFHGMFASDEFILGLINQDQYDHRQLHELYEMNRVVDETLEAELETWNTAADAQRTVTGDTNPEWASGFGTFPEEAFDYSTIYDTLGYTTSGDYISWLANPEELGGLDMTTMAFEAAYSGGYQYVPELVDWHVRAYVASIRTVSKYAVQNSDTLHSDDEFAADVETGGLSTAYVTTDALTRSSDDLKFVSENDNDPSTQTAHTADSATVAPGGAETVTTTVPEDAHTLSVRVQPRTDTFVRARLVDPDGDVVASFDPSAQDRYGGMEPWVVRDAAAGTWQVELENLRESGGQVTVRTAALQTEVETPDPRHVDSWGGGFEQRDYKVSPFVFFDADFIPDDDPLRATSIERDYDDVTDAPVDALTPADVAAGEHLGYDNLVVVHDDGRDDDYLAGLEEFVETGGNLVLTDTGVHQLGRLETSLTADITMNDVETLKPFYAGHLAEKFADHPLLEDTRPIQRMLWKIAPLGYSISGEAPMTLVDRETFESAGGRVAGLTDDRVAAGTLAPPEASGTIRDLVESEQGSVQVISGLLPPAKQTNLHPFGMQDYATSFFGHTIFVNALGHVQQRFVGGDRVKTFGGETSFEPAESPSDGVTASGSRDAGDAVQVGGDTVRVSVELSHDADEALEVRDVIPYSYEVIETGETVEEIEKRRGDGVQILTIAPDAPSGETLQFEYLARTAESVGTQRRSGPYDLGPAEVYDPEEEAWVDVAGTTQTHVVVAAEPLQDA